MRATLVLNDGPQRRALKENNMNTLRKSWRSIVSCLLLIGMLSAHAPAHSQAAPPKGQVCQSSAWTGTVTYSRTQTLTDSKTVKRVSGRGEDTKDFQMTYDYQALVAVVEDSPRRGSSTGKATVDHKKTLKETSVAKETNSCDRGKSWQEMTGTFTTESTTTGTGKDVANVTVAVSDNGTYRVGVSAPRINGITTGSQKSSFSGQCTPKEGKTTSFPAMESPVDGGSLTSNGSHRVDPANPTHLSGSYAETNLGVTERIAWNLEKCGAPLRITDLTFEDMKFPNWNQWREIVEQTGTIDGNLVKITATVFNASAESRSADIRFKETYRGDKWDGARPDAPLQDQFASVTVAPGEAREVEIVWDSSGYSWYDDGRPRYVQRIKAELWEKNKLTDNVTKNLKVAPKPLVLAHGPWSNWRAFESWQNILTTSHSYDWKAFPVGEKADKGIINAGRDMLSSEQTSSTAQNAKALQSYIEYAQRDRNAWHVDVVAHSLGGVIARHYIDRIMPPPSNDGRPQIAHLIMLGTPNLGTPCADVMDFAFEMTGKSPNVVREMRQDTMATFNRDNANRNGVKFSALAGNPIPTMCKSIVWNDGFVPVPSALWTIADSAQTKSIHIDLLGTEDFSGFVKPRLAIGPRGNHLPDLPNTKAELNHDAYGSGYFMPVAYRVELASNNASAELKPDFATAVTIASKGTLDIDVPVQQSLNFGITFMAAKDISATLYDDKGVVIGKNLAKSLDANAVFRSIYVDKPVSAGTWMLKLENTGGRETDAVIATWKNATKPGAKAPVVAANR